MKIRLQDKNVTHVKIAVFIGTANNGELIFNHREFEEFKAALQGTIEVDFINFEEEDDEIDIDALTDRLIESTSFTREYIEARLKTYIDVLRNNEEDTEASIKTENTIKMALNLPEEVFAKQFLCCDMIRIHSVKKGS